MRSNLKKFYLVIASLLALCPQFVNALEIEINTPNTAVTLPMEGRKGSAFYTVENDRFNVVVAFTVGSDEKEQLIRQVIQLTDGQTYRVSIGGFGSNLKATTISLARKNMAILASVVSCDTKETMSNCL